VSRAAIWNELKQLPQNESGIAALDGLKRVEVSESHALVAEIFAGEAAGQARMTELDLARAEKLILQTINLPKPLKSTTKISHQWSMAKETHFRDQILQVVGEADLSETYFARLMAPNEVVLLVLPKQIRLWSDVPARLTAPHRKAYRRLLIDDQLLEVARGTRLVDGDALLPALIRLTEGSGMGVKFQLDAWPLILRAKPWQSVILGQPVGGMLLTLAQDLEPDVQTLLNHHDLAGFRIVQATSDGNISLVDGRRVLANIPAGILLPGGGMTIAETVDKPERKFEKSAPLDYETLIEPRDYGEALLTVLRSPRVQPIPFADDYQSPFLDLPLVTRTKSRSDERVASALAAFPIIMRMNPRRAAAMSVATATRRLTCTGVEARALTCAFMTPDLSDEENFYRFQETVKGVSAAARVLNLPVISRQVVEADELNVVVGAVGRTDDGQRPVTQRLRDEGDFMVMLGTLKGELSGGVYLEEMLNIVGTEPPELDMIFEDRVQRAAREALEDGIIKSITTLDTGGLVATMAKSCLADPNQAKGCELHIHRKFRNDQLLFGESQSVIIVTLHEKHLLDLEKITQVNQVPSATIGRVRGERFIVNEDIDLSMAELQQVLQWPQKGKP
ncbi:MAG: hypothetical protein K9N34_09130, partial [Candidatus Marinimicrobia bacterium]|nr:hypothetical protein [Candidatus Neomarinimicrobiota bacterium]MCF7840951.1 hypothetical protein [Candidatus Neomarinimicrobiota bacterium]